METQATGGRGVAYAQALCWTTVVLSFAILAWLSGRAIDPRAGFVSVYTICLLAFALAALAGLGGLIYACNPTARRRLGFSSVLDALAGAFLMLLPFMLLALVAELFLDWNAAQAFTQAGIMTAGAAAGMEMVRLSEGKMVHVVVPLLGAFLFSMLWLIFSAAAQGIAG